MNRLAKSNSGKSVFRALEWAAMAEAKGLHSAALAWRKAHDEGWDEERYDQLAAEQYRREIADNTRR